MLAVVIDDNRDNADLIGELLKTLKISVKVLYNADDALHIVKTFYPDIIFIDLLMPTMDGFMLLEELKRNALITTKTRCIALTGVDSSNFRSRAFAVGFDEFLVKPIDFDQVKSLIYPGRGRLGKAS